VAYGHQSSLGVAMMPAVKTHQSVVGIQSLLNLLHALSLGKLGQIASYRQQVQSTGAVNHWRPFYIPSLIVPQWVQSDLQQSNQLYSAVRRLAELEAVGI
jgi:hypothetical protein